MFLLCNPIRVHLGLYRLLFIPTSISTLRTHPALSAVYIDVGEEGSGVILRIFDGRTIGLPFLFPDLAALRASVDSAASVWKKWPGSVDRDIVSVAVCIVVLVDLEMVVLIAGFWCFRFRNPKV